MSLPDRDPYPNHRPNIGIVLFNQAGQVWLGKRAGAEEGLGWQFPQGGLDEGETPEAGGLRELYEETGIKADQVELLARTEDWLAYDFPPEVLALKKSQNWIGQKQLWFAYRFLGTDADFDLTAVPPQEFEGFKWTSLDEAVDRIIAWKRDVYRQIARAFASFEQT